MRRATACGLIAGWVTAAWTLTLACANDAPGDPEAAPAAAEQPHQTMREIFENVAVLLPASIDAASYASPQSRDALRTRLDLLAASAGELQHHTRTREATFAQLSRMLLRDVDAARDRFAEGDFEASRERLIGSIWNCIECHTLQPSARRFAMADRLLERVEVEELMPHERALLSVLARRMNEALEIWEALLIDPTADAAQLDAAGVFRDYLAVALRVERDPARAADTLRLVERRSDLPPHLVILIPRWIDALDALAADGDPPATLERARALEARADGFAMTDDDRSRLVIDLLNTSVLLQLVQREDLAPADRSEAYWRLGEIESRGLGPFSTPKSELHLETAILAQPDGPFAERAFDELVASTAGPYGGLDGPNLPESVRKQLVELRDLIRASR